MTCQYCGATNENGANFCRMCASKLQTVCNCWVKKEQYNCGYEQCPGYRILSKRKAISAVPYESLET